jgi:hypothetical protein
MMTNDRRNYLHADLYQIYGNEAKYVEGKTEIHTQAEIRSVRFGFLRSSHCFHYSFHTNYKQI